MNDPFRVPADEIANRIAALQHILSVHRADGALIAQRIDLFYFTGCAQNAYLYVPAKGDPLLLVRKFAPRAAEDSPLKHQDPVDSIRQIPDRIRAAYGETPRVLGLVWDVLPVREFRFFRRLFSSHAYVDISLATRRLRSIKSRWETARIEASATLCSNTLRHLDQTIRPGMRATYLEGLAEAFARTQGHGGGIRVRYPEEDNRSCLVGPGEDVISSSGPVSVSFRAVRNGYHAERATVLCPGRNEEPSPRAASALIDMHLRVMDRAVPGMPFCALQDLAGTGSERVQGAGRMEVSCRGIGLELYEAPGTAESPEEPLLPGMCLVLETRCQTGDGVVFFVRDTISVEENGFRVLGNSA